MRGALRVQTQPSSAVNTRMTSGAVVTIVPSCAFGSPCRPRWGEQPLGAHHAQHSRPGDPDPVEDPQPRVDLAMALALERGAGQVAANGRQQLRIRQCGRRPPAYRASTPRWALQTSPSRVERRARPFPHSTPARDHSAAPTSRRSLRSSSRPPRRQREATLRCAGTLAQQLVLHRQLANVSLGSIQLARPAAHRPAPSDRAQALRRPGDLPRPRRRRCARRPDSGSPGG